MTKYWVTADQHWNHTNIIKYTDRPYKDVVEMNEALILNWNTVVQPEDVVFHLGDVGLFKTEVDAKQIVTQLNGHKILIFGNHDKRKWDWLDIGFSECGAGPVIFQNYILSHKPLQFHQNLDMRTNLHGHIHEKPSPCDWQINVSVEQTNYTPVLLTGGYYGEEKEEQEAYPAWDY